MEMQTSLTCEITFASARHPQLYPCSSSIIPLQSLGQPPRSRRAGKSAFQTHQSSKRQFQNQQIGTALIFPDLPQSDGARFVATGLFDCACGGAARCFCFDAFAACDCFAGHGCSWGHCCVVRGEVEVEVGARYVAAVVVSRGGGDRARIQGMRRVGLSRRAWC